MQTLTRHYENALCGFELTEDGVSDKLPVSSGILWIVDAEAVETIGMHWIMAELRRMYAEAYQTARQEALDMLKEIGGENEHI